MNFLCCRITVLAHNLLSQRPASISELLGPFIFYLSGRLQPHEMKFKDVDDPESFLERFLEFFPGFVLRMES